MFFSHLSDFIPGNRSKAPSPPFPSFFRRLLVTQEEREFELGRDDVHVLLGVMECTVRFYLPTELGARVSESAL